MTKILRTLAVALGMTTIALGSMVHPLLKPGRKLIYHWSGSSLDLFAPLFLDILIVWLLLTLVLLSAQVPGRRRLALWGGVLALFVPAVTIKGIALCRQSWTPDWFDLTLFSSLAFIWLLLLVFWRPTFEKPFNRVIGLATTVLGFVAISGAIYLGELAWLGWSCRSLNDPLPLHHSREASITETGKPRVIWIVLDELSYQQVYEHRFPGLKLPTFDALARQATVFDHVIPAGKATDEVLPSLLTGKPVDQIRSSAEGQLSMRDPNTGEWKPFEQHNTVFQDALNAGYSTGIAGWWNPYCRILPAVLDHCFWRNSLITENGMTADESVPSNMVELLRASATTGSIHSLIWPWLQARDNDAAFHIADYEMISAAADRLLLDRSANFVLLHLPIPHPGGIYNHRTGQLTTGASDYIDNLALADRYMAHVQSLLEQNGEWDSSAIVIMGDHSWRTSFIWKNSAGWTEEEERASLGGQFDSRPVYIVKLPGQQKGMRSDLAFRAVDTRRLLDALIHRKVSSAEALLAWLRQVIGTESPQANSH